jgi:hypothetical protein
MTTTEKSQLRQWRGVLFYIFVGLFVLIVVLTIMAVFLKDILPFKLPIPESERKIFFYGFIAEIAVCVVALFKVMFKLKKPVGELEEKPIPNVSGRYKYEEIWCDNKTVYEGECCIKQDGQDLTVLGERTKECNGHKNKKVSVHWSSTWAEVCNDNKIRMDYAITENGGGRGYAILELRKRSRKSMLGEIHLFKEDSLYGTLKFKKIYNTKTPQRLRPKRTRRRVAKAA